MRKFDKLLKELKKRYFCGISKRDEKVAEVNAKNNKGDIPLHKAANKGKIRNVKAIIEAGGNVNAGYDIELSKLRVHKNLICYFVIE